MSKRQKHTRPTPAKRKGVSPSTRALGDRTIDAVKRANRKPSPDIKYLLPSEGELKASMQGEHFLERDIANGSRHPDGRKTTASGINSGVEERLDKLIANGERLISRTETVIGLIETLGYRR